MTTLSSRRALSIYFAALLALIPASALAQSQSDDPPTPDDETASAAASPQVDDDATVQVMEPDYRLVNLPTTLRLPRYRASVEITHRFLGNLENGDFGDQLANLFGIDQGAIVGLEFRFAVARHVQVGVYRTSFDKDIQIHGKYDALHQSESVPLSVSALLSIEGGNNFQERYAPALGAVVSRNFSNRVAAYAAPIWVHNTAAAVGIDQDTFYVGIGGRLRFVSTAYLVAEVSPRLSGYKPGQTAYAFGIEKRVGGHLFQLNFSNSSGSTYGQIARGGAPDSLYLGFNIARKFF